MVAGGSLAIDAIDHGKVVLSAILAFRDKRNTKVLDYAIARVNETHFVDPVQKLLFTLCVRYADQTHGILPRSALEDFLRNKEPGKAPMYVSYYDALTKTVPSLPGFKHSIEQLRELSAERATGEALAEGMEILRHGLRNEKGVEFRGHEDARAVVLAAFADVERGFDAGSSPEGDIGKEAYDVRSDYAKSRELRLSGMSPGIGTGITQLDNVLGGGPQNGELAFVVGYTSAGKTGWCINWAWDAAVRQGKQVVYFTTETLRGNIRRKMVARHSRLEKFGSERGLNSNDIRQGTLSESDYRLFQAVLEDWENPSYGNRYIVQVPRGATISVLESRLASISRQFMPDIVFVDYLQLLKPERAKRDRREELSPIIQDAKQVAATFHNGRGVPFVSPWQISREGRKEAKTRGCYQLTDLSETAEAERTPDVIISLLEPDNDDSKGRRVPLQLDLLKARDNARNERLEVTADFANSYYTVRDRSTDDSVLTSFTDEE